jgi:hypothetical protein
MPLEENKNDNFAAELKVQIRAFNLRAIRYFVSMVGLVFAEVYVLGVILKLGIFVQILAFPTAGYFLYKIISGYSNAIKCPRCGQPSNWNPRWLSAIPFVSKCQNCGLETSSLPRKKNEEN